MPLTLLCGPTNSGKIGRVLEGFAGDCGPRGTGAWLLVPTRADARRAESELATRHGVVIGGRIGIFRDLVSALADAPPERELGRGSAVVLVSRLATTRSFPGARFAGFAHSTARRLAELRSLEAVDRSLLEEALAELPAGEGRAWRELLRQYRRSLDQLELWDAADQERKALAAADTAGVSVPVYLYGFDDFTRAQVELLVRAARSTHVTLTLPFEPGRMVYERRQELLERFRTAGARVQISGSSQFASGALLQLEQRLYEPTADPIDLPVEPTAPAPVKFAECCGPLQEAEVVVRQVGMLLQAGVDPGDIACLSADPRLLRPLLEASFRRAGVPAHFELQRAAAETPAGRALLCALRSVTDHSWQQYLGFARSRVSPVPPALVDTWHLHMRRQRSTGGPRWFEHEAVVEPLRSLHAEPHGRSIEHAFRSLLELCDASEPGDSRLLAAVDEAFDELVQSLPAERLSVHELIQLVESLTIPPPLDRLPHHVLVAPVTHVRTARFRSVVVFGLHSGGWSVRDDEHGAAAVARELVHTAISRATHELRLVRQAASSDGRARAPHPAWMELRRLLTQAPTDRRGLDDTVPSPSEVLFESEIGQAVAAAHGCGVDVPRELLDAYVPPAPERSDDAGAAFREHMQGQHTLGVTQLEQYAQCSARWFIERKLLPREPLTSSRAVVGSLVHAALAVLFTELRGLWEEGGNARARALDRAVARAAKHSAERTSRLDRVTARLTLERMAQHSEQVGAEVMTEVGFGSPGDELDAVRIAGVDVTGRIDRVDVEPDKCAVIHDYKLASSAVSAARLLDEGRYQLPLYWRALEQHGLAPRAALYRPLGGEMRPRGLVAAEYDTPLEGLYRTDRMSDDELDALVEDGVEQAGRIVSQMQQGTVAAQPRGGSCPSWCDLQPICRVEGR